MVYANGVRKWCTANGVPHMLYLKCVPQMCTQMVYANVYAMNKFLKYHKIPQTVFSVDIIVVISKTGGFKSFIEIVN